MKKVGLGLMFILLAAAVLAAAGLAWAHRQISRIDPVLPEPGAVLARDAGADLPVRIRYLNTASQPMPRAAVLEPSLDPHPEHAYVMSHASFALEWNDGRLFLIDLGMDRDAARAFGRPLEWFGGAASIEPHGSVAEQLGDAVQRVAGLGFTHLHVDHTQGIAALCASRAEMSRLPIFQTELQAQETNYTTRPAREQIEAAPCALSRKLPGGGLVSIPGFAGLAVMAAAGHTPGSQIFVAHVRGRSSGVTTWVFTGDAVNHADGIALDLPKPRLYSRFVVPESAARLARVRRFLSVLAASDHAELLVSHDQHQIEASGVASW